MAGHLIALTTTEWLDVAVAAGTLILAAATGALAGFTYKLAQGADEQAKSIEQQAKATVTLAEAATEQLQVSRRHLAATARPRLRYDPQMGAYVTDGRYINIHVENQSSADAIVRSTNVQVSGEGRAGTLIEPRVEPGQSVALTYDYGSEIPMSDRNTPVQCGVLFEGADGSRQDLTVNFEMQAGSHEIRIINDTVTNAG